MAKIWGFELWEGRKSRLGPNQSAPMTSMDPIMKIEIITLNRAGAGGGAVTHKGFYLYFGMGSVGSVGRGAWGWGLSGVKQFSF
jgi:hypothetical protein